MNDRKVVDIIKSKILIICMVIASFLALSITASFVVFSQNDEKEKTGSEAGNQTDDPDGNVGDIACSGEGVSIECTEGNTGAVQIPIIGMAFMETDEKHHWDMDAGMNLIVAKLYWEDTSWDMEFSIGTGECPDQGVEKKSATGNNGTIILDYSEDGLPEGEWFAHIKSMNAAEHRGESCEYSIDITVFKCDENH